METRSQRVAAALEDQLEKCQSVLGACMKEIEEYGECGEWQLRQMLGLMNISTRLGAVIARLEPGPAPENRETRNSNPQ